MSRRPFEVSQAAGGVTPKHLVQWSGRKVIGDSEAIASDIHGLRVTYALSVDFNSSNTDTAILLPLPAGVNAYRVHGIRISGATHAINAATCGVFTQPNATGVPVVASGTPVTVTQTGNDINNNMQSLTIVNQDIIAFGDTTLYFRVQTPEGSSAKANVNVVYELLDITSQISDIAPPAVPPPANMTSSAGVFDSNGVLVRTLWSVSLGDPRALQPATAWDGTLDDGSIAPSGNYTIGVLSHNVQYAWEGAIGNSSPDHTNVIVNNPSLSGAQNTNVYSGYHSYGGLIGDMAITAAGEMYFVTGYDERMNTIHMATTANPQYAIGLIRQSFRNTYTANENTCTDGIIAYFHFWNSPSGANANGVWGINCSTKLPVTFPSGSSGIAGGNFLGLSTTTQFIVGIAVQQSGNFIFISRSENATGLFPIFSIWTCHKTTGATLVDNLLGFAFQGRICTDPTTGNPWVTRFIQTATAAATWDPFLSQSGWTFSNGNRTVNNGINTNGLIAYSSGTGTKFYYEAVLDSNPNGTPFAYPIGVASSTNVGGADAGFIGFDANSIGFYGNALYVTNHVQTGGSPSFGVGDNVGIACDLVNKTIWIRVNGGNWNGSPTANPATNTGGYSISTISSPALACVGAITANDGGGPNIQRTANFASANWVYAAPAGFSQLPGVTRTPAVTKLNFDGVGNLTDSGISATAGLINPSGVTISPDGSTLLVTDFGTSQVHAFNTSDGSVKSAWGNSGRLGDAGGYANGPAVSNTRYMFAGYVGFSEYSGWITYVPADGSFWFSDAGNLRYLHFSAGNSPTYIEQIAYFPGQYASWVCGNDPTRVFGSYLEFKIDYSKPLQVGNGSWTLVNNWFFNVPGGNRGDGAMRWTTTIGGHTFIVLKNSNEVYEMTASGYRDTGIAISFDYIDRAFNLWAVSGTSGNGQILTGDVGQFFVNRFNGLDGSNNPTWVSNPAVRPSTLVTTTATFPALFPQLQIDSDSSNVTETLANGVIPVFNVHGNPPGGVNLTQHHFGGIDSATGILKFSTHAPVNSNFMSGQLYPPVPNWIPQTFGGINGFGVTDACGAFQTFLPGTPDVFTLYRGEDYGNCQCLFLSHWHESGLLVNRKGCAAPYFALTSDDFINPPVINAGNLDFVNSIFGNILPMNGTYGFMGTPALAGNVVNGGIAFVNGTYYVYHNDEWYHGGIHRWKISNPGSEKFTSTPVTWNSSSFVPKPYVPYNFLSGLPFNTVNLPNNTNGWTRNPTSDNTSGSRGTAPWFRVLTSATVCDLHLDQDLSFEATFLGTTSVTYSWTRVGSGNWSLTGIIQYTGSSGTDFNGGTLNRHTYIDVLDNTGKKILRFEGNVGRAGYPTNNGGTCTVNGNFLRPPLFIGGGPDIWGAWCAYPQPLSIIANVNAGTMTVSYAGFTISGVTVNDVGANMAMPAQMMVSCIDQVANNFTGLDIAAMKFADIP